MNDKGLFGGSNNKGVLVGILVGVLLFSFTGNPALVVLGLLAGLIFDGGKNRKGK